MKLIKRFLISLLALVVPMLALQPVAMAAAQKPAQFKQALASTTTLEVKFDQTAEVTLQNDDFVSQNHQSNLSGANSVLKTKKAAKKHQMVTPGYYKVTLEPGQDVRQVADQLKSQPGVAEAYPAPIPAPLPSTPNLVSNQNYLNPAPQNMGITAAATLPGATGKAVKVVDVEYAWNSAHEDLAKARATGALWPMGTPANPWAYDAYTATNATNHGTAVAGILAGTRNTFGINGIASDSDFHMVNSYSAEAGWDPASAITLATSKMSAGDVMLIEQQTYGPDGTTLVPIEWIPSVYDAIKAATAKNIVVIEPAGNGAANLDDSVYGSTFPLGKPSSGALMIGAGKNCVTDSYHSRTYSSNYGKRVLLQGPGECVASTGYGDAYGSGNTAYTNSFNGTSSASAVVAGVAASVSSAYETLYGKPATPTTVWFALGLTGSAQDTTVNPGNIGPLPNLQAAIKWLDTTPPTAPTSPTIYLNSSNQPVVKWTAATDNAAVTNYNIYRNGKLYKTVSNVVKFIDTSVSAKTKYSYQVQAVDALGNKSAKSPTVTITTK